ncbi:LAYN [Mytilus coruscus]|uniref:LAYN n=1 Tax=Mytilus coruscus TaxID=42192 RepID=A0A6J8B0F0_MYTCO|nr:LAYN [Mytilus coruscus]
MIQTSLAVEYKGNINASIDITPWKIGVFYETSLISCIMMCMQADNCFWTTFNNGACDLLSVTKKDMDNSQLIVYNGGLQIFQMIRGCSEQACQLSDGCVFIDDDSSCIKYYVDRLRYHSARTICKRDGGELFRIDSLIKQKRVQYLLNDVLNVNANVTVQGIKNSANKWLFDDGTLMTYFNWNAYEGQPNNGTSELYIYIKSSKQCQWHDIGLYENPFLCEIHA